MKKIYGKEDNYEYDADSFTAVSFEDPTCNVKCYCGENLWVSDYKIVRCPKCGKGYKTEFAVYEYAEDEEDIKQRSSAEDVGVSLRKFINKCENIKD